MKKDVVDIFSSALKAVDPFSAVRQESGRILRLYREGTFTRLFVIAAGKAAFPMMRATVQELGDHITSGIVLTKYGHAQSGIFPESITIVEAGHPVPDENGLAGTRRIISLLDSADDRTLVLCLLSGGASSLLVAPLEGIALNEKQNITRLLLAAGADIGEINTVRKHLSRIKGGRFAERAYPAQTVSLIISDVIGDRLDVIASGPTAPDPSMFADARAVLKKYGLETKTPQSILNIVRAGMQGSISETPKPGHELFMRVQNQIIAGNRMATDAAGKRASELGYEVVSLGNEIQGRTADIGRLFSENASKEYTRIKSTQSRICLIGGGETTVHVTGTGKGGRNTEMALIVAQEIAGISGVTFLSAGTDGTDGPTDAAGAIVDGDTINRGKNAGLDSTAYLRNNDSYTFFKQIDALFVTGPTGTNVMDLYLLLICNSPR